MQPTGFIMFWAWLTGLVAAFSVGPSFAHVLEAWPRLIWSPELWREATVFNGQFTLFLYVGGPLDIVTILLPAVLAFLVRQNVSAALAAGAGAGFFALALLLWFLRVSPGQPFAGDLDTGSDPA